MMRGLRNIYNLGVKELRSLLGDKAMLALIVFAFTVSVYSSATVMPGSLHLAPIAVADMDKSQLSSRIINAFYRPWFLEPELITADEMDAGLDAGRYTFAINIPPNFQRDVLAGRQPEIQVNVDATRMSQAFTGNGYIQNIITGEVNSFVARYRDNSVLPVELAVRMRFNPNLEQERFGAVMAIINNITMLAIVLTGSALIREREHGTIEHLLVMPVTPFEIMMAKIWSMGLVVLVVSGLSLMLMVQGILQVPIEGRFPVYAGGGAQPVRHYLNRHFYGHPRPLDAAAGAADDSGAAAAADAFRRIHAAGKYAAAGTGYYVDHADHPLRQSGAGDTVPRRQLCHRLAAVLNLAGYRRVFFTIALLRFRKTIGEMA
jgi:ABC-2 type transport system permease protein